MQIRDCQKFTENAYYEKKIVLGVQALLCTKISLSVYFI